MIISTFCCSHVLCIKSKDAFHLSGLAELKELVYVGVNGKKKLTPPLRERACELHFLACVQCQKNWKLFCNIRHSNLPRISRVVARTGQRQFGQNEFCQFSQLTRSIYVQDGSTGQFCQMERGLST